MHLNRPAKTPGSEGALCAQQVSSHGFTGVELCQACCRDGCVKPSLRLLV